MDELSGDEALVLWVATPTALVFLLGWLKLLWKPRAFGRTPPGRLELTFVPLVASGMLWHVLRRWADWEVREHGIYVVLFTLLGLAWMGGAVLWAKVMGVRLREDVVERGNAAAAPALGGAVLGASLCYVGSNIGGGATIWSTILPGALATFVWAGLWVIVEILTGVSEWVSIERDVASGWRIGGGLVAAGLVLGRAMAGDYRGAEATFRDLYVHGRVAAVVMLAVVVMQWCWRGRSGRVADPLWRGLVPAIVMIAAAAAYVLYLGRWEGFR